VLRNPIEGTTLTLKESDFNRKVTKINEDGIREARKKEQTILLQCTNYEVSGGSSIIKLGDENGP
jgi:hypothetical protein